jgi:hypothetical protein
MIAKPFRSMPSIMILYRRVDSAGTAGGIFDELVSHFGKENVFMDIDNIPLGTDYRDHIKDILSRTGILLAVIGPRWLSERRLYEESDLVRIEIQTALENKVAVIPLLVDHVNMPKGDDLPASIGELSFLNAAEVSPERDFHVHMARLIRSIKTTLLSDTRCEQALFALNDNDLPEAKSHHVAPSVLLNLENVLRKHQASETAKQVQSRKQLYSWVLALVTSSIGIFAIMLAIPLNGFTLGTTLMVGGTVALSGGLIHIGLALNRAIVFWVLGLWASIVGLIAIGLGIPLNEFTLGTTLMIGGTVVLSGGGLTLIHLAILKGQVRVMCNGFGK